MSNDQNEHLKLGISIGDYNGIGIEIIIKTFSESRLLQYCTPIIYGSTRVFSYYKKVLDLQDFKYSSLKSMDDLRRKSVYIVNCWQDEAPISMGTPTPESGRFAMISLEQAAEDLSKGKIDALVTAPFDKHNMHEAGFRYPGHTEFLRDKLQAKDSLMLMVSDNLKVGVVTGHIPLNEVASQIDEQRILSKLKILHNSLRRDFGVQKPRIAVLGLNPHAGDRSLLGGEEASIIQPAIEQAQQMKIAAYGPFPADGFFGSSDYRQFDACLAMYHDQGLIPFKALSFGKGVNYTAGLSAIRTSPDHGTAFKLAGKNEASPDSFRRAVFLALDIARLRKDYRDMTANPLKKSSLEV